MNTSVNLVALSTIMIKEITRITRIWQQTIIPPIMTTSLYFIIFGNLIGERIGSMDGYRYIEFIVPGLIIMSVITSAYSNVSSSFFSMKFEKSIEEILISPTPNWIVLLGFICGGIFRGLFVGCAVAIISFLFTGIQIHSLLILLSTAFLTSVLFALAGFTNGLFAKKFDDVSIIPTFVLTPLIYLGGVFYSIKLLPDFWQTISHINPILYMVNAFRFGFIGISDISLGVSYSIIIIFSATLFIINLHLLKIGYGLRH